jgi:phosphatidylglycerol:prolipoprotein diacylglycerol transferase
VKPILGELFGWDIPAYPLFLMLAFVSASLITMWRGYRHEPPLPLNPLGAVLALLFALIGGRALWIAQFRHLSELPHAVRVWEGGLSIYGCILGGVLALLLYSLIYRLSWIEVLDIAAPPLAWGQAVGRVGCFLAGCCWGSVTAAPWGVGYPSGSPAYFAQINAGILASKAAYSLPVHPVQLYEMLGLLVMFVALMRHSRRRPFPGSVCLHYFLFYGALRFVMEMFRTARRGGDTQPSVFGLLSVAQIISLVAVALAAVLILSVGKHTAGRAAST